MILQNLIQYYETEINKNDSSLAPFGFEYKNIPFIILLNEKGEFLTIQDARKNREIKKKTLIPKAVKRSGIGCHPNYLWDNARYVFGVESCHNQKESKALDQKRESFLKNIKELIPELLNNKEIQAVIAFLESNYISKLQEHPLWGEIVEFNPNLSFSIENTGRLVCEQETVMKAFSLFFTSLEKKTATCLLTGKIAPIARLHPLIQGVSGSQSSGASLISYNMPSAESFNKEQGYNAPISQSATFAYATALNHLLESPQKIEFDQVMTVIFWAQEKNHFENTFSCFLKAPSKQKNAFLSKLQEDIEDSLLFFVHIISPQGARLSVRFSWEGTIGELKKRLKKHFEQLELHCFSAEQEDLSIYSLLKACSSCSDVTYAPPRIAGELLMNLLQGLPYPTNLLAILLQRLSDKEGISYRRVSLMKAQINQVTKDTANCMQPSLDFSNKSIGYLLGRLFFILEIAKKNQINKKDRSPTHFYKIASITPKKTFSFLLKRYSFHKSSIQEKYYKYVKETTSTLLNLIQEIPGGLSLEEQAKFAIGFYQQKQHMFLQF